jgi:hypothetical protein
VETNNTTQTYLFFLQLADELPDFFFSIAEQLSQYNICLVPVRAKELSELSSGVKQHVVTFVPNFDSLKRLCEIRKRYLDFALSSSKFVLYDISSFGPISIAHKLHRLKNYNHYYLPVGTKAVAAQILTNVYEERKIAKKWPGGRRAKLPVLREM